MTKEKEYEVPYLDDDTYLMQKLWVEKQEMKRRIYDHDKYMRIMTKNAKNTFKRGLPKHFDRLEDIPEVVVRKAEEAKSK